MPHMLEDFGDIATRSVEDMKAAALKARNDHAAAELARHMILTTRKFMDRGKSAAVEAVVADWLNAWNLERGDWPEIAAEMEALTAAFFDYCIAPSDGTDRAVRAAWLGLKAAHDSPDRTLEDQMAWRSVCAHGWWGDVSPAPPAYRHDDDSRPMTPFWAKGCPPECLG
jgi:hypothetical protein